MANDSASKASGLAQLPAPEALQVLRFESEQHRYLMVSFALPQSVVPRLTAAEQQVLERVLAGDSQAQIARARGTSRRTVANQIASLFEKLGVSSRLELARACSSTGPLRSD